MKDKKSLRHGLLRGEVKIDYKDVLSFEKRANNLHSQTGLAMQELKTIRELFTEQKGQNENDFVDKKNYSDDIKHSLIINFE
jgi:predicted PilT family ATPase